jgi:hypothetical protein
MGGNTIYGLNIVDLKRGDVTGDGVVDTVILAGKRISESGFTDDIRLIIRDGRTGAFAVFPLSGSAGYDPRLFLGDFNNDRVNDIFISIPLGGSGGLVFSYLFTYRNNDLKPLFNAEVINRGLPFKARFIDGYRMEVFSTDEKYKFIIDLSLKKEQYKDLYDENGNLKKPVDGLVSTLVALIPAALALANYYSALSEQRIIGQYNADTIGYIQAFWRIIDGVFTPVMVNAVLVP